MKGLSLITASIFMIITIALWAGDFSVYPGARFDQKMTKDAIRMSAGAPGAYIWWPQLTNDLSCERYTKNYTDLLWLEKILILKACGVL